MIDGGEAIRKLALNLARYSGLAPLARPFVGGIGAILMPTGARQSGNWR